MFWKKPAPGLRPRWLIVGLGNPGGEYRGTRHNVGFDLIDLLAEQHKIKVNRAKHRALTGLGSINDVPVLLVKPLTFMNLSGQAVAPLARENEILPERVLVVADDLDLPTGKLRLRDNGSPGGHNGHKSLVQYLKTQTYPRLKIGIGRGETNIDHVLGGFPPDERVTVDKAIKAAARACEAVIQDRWQDALTRVDDWNKSQ